MTDVAVIGGGPAGMSAALLTAKNGLETTLFDTGETALHAAYLFNYLGAPDTDGDAFVDIGHDQIREFDVNVVDAEVTDVAADEERFTVTADEEYDAEYVVFATGRARDLAESLGCDTTDEGAIDVDLDMHTSVDGVYAAGWAVRPQKIQAVISAGDGAAAALDILSTDMGEPFHDFDVPSDAE
ncbi:FAD-dependent oxidoreductase [Halobacteriaceae archaeon GCM10025711]